MNGLLQKICLNIMMGCEARCEKEDKNTNIIEIY